MPFDRQATTDRVDLLIPGMTCAGCMGRVERCLQEETGVTAARVNLSAHSAWVEFDPQQTDAEALVAAVSQAGYAARPYDPSLHGAARSDEVGRGLLLRLGVAGLAAMNVMLLAISVWSGAEAAMRDLLHWVSALIALPTVVYAGQPFYRSAAQALAAKRLNMDVPISLAVILAAGNSVSETMHGGAHAYFDAAVMLLFFLLLGRYLEHRTRASARTAAAELMAMTGRTALRVMPDGSRAVVALTDLCPGMEIEVAPGERIPADGEITVGATDLDRSLITGESRPEPAECGTEVHAGMLNLTGAIQIRVTATGDETLLAEIARMVDAAERSRGRYDRIADRAARIYAPLVHILAAVAFVAWYWVAGDAHLALQIAIAVLIVTCPCALALAVPTVHAVASARLFRQGIFLKDGAELERLAEVDTVAFDKTGTLTEAEPSLIEAPDADDPAWPVLAALASRSRHPVSRALSAEARRLGIKPASIGDVIEHPGYGVEGSVHGQVVRLGRPGWAGPAGDGVALVLPDRVVRFRFAEALRAGAAGTCTALKGMQMDLAIVSGDHAVAVARVAQELEITRSVAGMVPGDKLRWLGERDAEGAKVLMVGDGLNDGPALAAAHASMSPASAVDVAKTAAGLVFTGDRLNAVAEAVDVARQARLRTFQSFGIAVAYNSIAVPLAMAGLVTPLIAAIAMSASSILVVLNALRLRSRT